MTPEQIEALIPASALCSAAHGKQTNELAARFVAIGNEEPILKKCLHMKKTKPHWRRKPPRVVTWRERDDMRREIVKRRQLHRMANNLATLALFGRI